MSTHDIGQARRIGGEIVLLHRGPLVETGPAEEFFPEPPHAGSQEIHGRRTAGLTHDPPRGKFIHVLAPQSPRRLPHPRCRSVRHATGIDAGQIDRGGLSTTSTQDSGLFEYLLPLYKKKTGVVVKVIAQGTGQALDTGRRGDADVVAEQSNIALRLALECEASPRRPCSAARGS
jgi:ABC-type glutathione transport system ATPase component